VTDAALSFGFTDISHFSRAFKKQFAALNSGMALTAMIAPTIRAS
jgi:AraC-like DNA-binding protein